MCMLQLQTILLESRRQKGVVKMTAHFLFYVCNYTLIFNQFIYFSFFIYLTPRQLCTWLLTSYKTNKQSKHSVYV